MNFQDFEIIQEPWFLNRMLLLLIMLFLFLNK